MNLLQEEPLFALPAPTMHTRWASMENLDATPGSAGAANKGRKGAPCVPNIAPGETFVMAHAQGSGTVRRFWITIPDRSPNFLRGLVLRAYWDGSEKPALEAPLGDFFCLPLGQMATFENAWFDSGEGRSFNCRLPMPFRSGFRLTVTNESAKGTGLFFYDVNFTLGDEHGNDTGYFHCHWRRENPTTLGRDFEILSPVNGRGRFLGCNMGVISHSEKYGNLWWGEGEVKMYLDGDSALPTLCGTGTEDYIGTGWGQGEYARAWHGCPLANHEKMRYGFYRLHGPDPVYFHRDIRVTIQQIGHAATPQLIATMEAHGLQSLPFTDDGGKELTLDDLRAETERGHLFERADDWCATAYFYLDKSSCDLPPIAPFAERIARLDIPTSP